MYITGRKKEIIITAAGEKIPPRPIESAIKQELPIVSNALLIGDRQRFLCCLLTLKVHVHVYIYRELRISDTCIQVYSFGIGAWSYKKLVYSI